MEVSERDGGLVAGNSCVQVVPFQVQVSGRHAAEEHQLPGPES